MLGQGATLLFGLIKSHPWVGGNKRTATALLELFLNKNGLETDAGQIEWVELVLAIEADRQQPEEITDWLRQHTQTI